MTRIRRAPGGAYMQSVASGALGLNLRVAEHHTLVINAVIFAEVSVRFPRIKDVNDALRLEWFDRRAISFPSP